MRKLILLDFDGVILKRHPLLKQVSYKCQQYTKKYTRLTNPVHIKDLNEQLYSSTGHTLLGLQKLGFPATIDEFNSYVYGLLNYATLFKHDEELEHQGESFKTFLEHCQYHNIDVRIFSNAPDIWVKAFVNNMTRNTINVQTLSDITSCHLKPTHTCYNMVEKQFRTQDIIFVDDKLANLMPVMNRSRWRTYLYGQNTQYNKYIPITNKIIMIDDLQELIQGGTF